MVEQSLSSPAYDPVYLKKELTTHEGRRASVYVDSRGFSSVGIGHNLAIPQTPYVIDALYACDVGGCEASLDARFPWWRKLDPVRQFVMMEMMFNLGGAKLAGFVNTLAAIESGHYYSASVGMLASAWASEVGHRAVELADAMRTGVAP